jgi:hypothetical protein
MNTKFKNEKQANEDVSLNIERIRRQILFGKVGAWTKYFNALLFFGIDVKALMIENEILRHQLRDREKPLQQLS